MACSGCSLTLFDFAALTADARAFFDFLVSHGVITDRITCPTCSQLLIANDFSDSFKCGRYHHQTLAKKSKKKIKCNFHRCIFFGTWFFNSKLSHITASRLTGLWILQNPPRQEFAMREFDLTAKTVVDWFSFCRQVCIDWCVTNSSEMLGGPGIIVEIDEAKIGKRKYNRGRMIDGYWVFGAYERESGRIFLVPVQERTAAALIGLITERIAPGTIIISDCWRSYNSLSEEGFTHLKVNHSINFVDPDSGAHTNSIERVWRDVRSKIPRYGTRKAHSVGYLAEFMFKRTFPDHRERLHNFFTSIGRLFPPQMN